jgi:hypothetical protein
VDADSKSEGLVTTAEDLKEDFPIKEAISPGATREMDSPGRIAQEGDATGNLKTEASAAELLERWKAKAVAEFPELGIAGSRFNQAFLAEVKILRDRNGAELAVPNWPYIVALQVNTQIERERLMAELNARQSENVKVSPEKSPVLESTPPAARAVTRSGTAGSGFGSYRVSELKTMQVMPRGGTFSGLITKIEKPLSAGALEVSVTLDGFLPCEINLDRKISPSTRSSNGLYPYYNYLWDYPLSSKSSSSLRLMMDPNQTSVKLVEITNSSAQSSYSGRVYSDVSRKDLLTLSVGQAATVEGVIFIKSNRKPFLKGVLAKE